MSAPLDQATAAAAPRWGVLDEHTGEWLASSLPDERAAWRALLEVDSPHPWELAVREQPAEESPADPRVECPDCWTTGECDGCGRECTRCDGDGWLPWSELAEHERRRHLRRTQRGAA
ncbi:hypothetical protein [Blastococcus mobilis]|uniref:Uncharacterized protein n=1 Tax=Blastococcus mobilis TaxID=1938746 RepID=A0A238VGZ9_9ACTN|nr:hypothetical protein [Blastococcus mobilis]SNR32789.1 hypothetical protein SAMN06272737_10353 [Blastococcus mobilis]